MDFTEVRNMRTIKDKVFWIMSRSKKARNSDKYLLLLYWRYIDGVDFNNFIKDFMTKATCEKSIIRARQLIQADGLLLADPEIADKRRHAESAYRQCIGQENEVPEGDDYDSYSEYCGEDLT